MVSRDYRVGGKIRNGRPSFYVRYAGRIIASGFRTRRAAELYAIRHLRKTVKRFGVKSFAKRVRRKRRRVRRSRVKRVRRHRRRRK